MSHTLATGSLGVNRISMGDRMTTAKIIDTIGTLQLIDTGRRCSVRNVRILRMHCTKNCAGDNALLHDAILGPIWEMTKKLDGYHQGCDPESAWQKDPVGTKLQHDKLKSQSLLGPPPGSCIACDQLDCTGAEGKDDKARS